MSKKRKRHQRPTARRQEGMGNEHQAAVAAMTLATSPEALSGDMGPETPTLERIRDHAIRAGYARPSGQGKVALTEAGLARAQEMAAEILSGELTLGEVEADSQLRTLAAQVTKHAKHAPAMGPIAAGSEKLTNALLTLASAASLTTEQRQAMSTPHGLPATPEELTEDQLRRLTYQGEALRPVPLSRMAGTELDTVVGFPDPRPMREVEVPPEAIAFMPESARRRAEPPPLPTPPAGLLPAQYSPAVESARDAMRAWQSDEGDRLAELMIRHGGAGVEESSASLVARMCALLRQAEHCYVGPEVCELLAIAGPRYPLDLPLPLTNAPSPELWVHLARPLDLGTYLHASGRPILYRLAGFTLQLLPPSEEEATRLGVVAYSLSGRWSLGVVYYARIPETPLPVPVATGQFLQGQTIGDQLSRLRVSDPENDSLYGVGNRREETLERMAKADQLVGAFLSFVGQKLLAQSRGDLSRDSRRRLERAEPGAAPPRVRVITLRRRQSSVPSGEHRDVDWSCRWWVGAEGGGHWRTYHRGTPEERAVWILPYIKGPDSAPLKAPSGKLFAVVR